MDRHDVGVFEGGDRLGLGLESGDERWVDRDVLVDHLDGHVASDVRLDRAEHRSGRPVLDPLEETVAAEGLTSQVEPQVLLEDALVEPGELG